MEIKEIDRLVFWIQDYWNAWFAPGIEIDRAIEGKDNLDILSGLRIRTFEEYVAGKSYYQHKCDMRIIPENLSGNLIGWLRFLIS